MDMLTLLLYKWDIESIETLRHLYFWFKKNCVYAYTCNITVLVYRGLFSACLNCSVHKNEAQMDQKKNCVYAYTCITALGYNKL